MQKRFQGRGNLRGIPTARALYFHRETFKRRQVWSQPLEVPIPSSKPFVVDRELGRTCSCDSGLIGNPILQIPVLDWFPMTLNTLHG